MESGTKLRPGYMVINNGMIHYQSKAIKVFNMIKLHGKSIRVNKDTKSLDVGANLFIGNLDHASIYLGGNGNFTLIYWYSLKLTRKTPTASTYKSVIICATSTMFKRIGLPKPNLNSEYSQRLSTLLCRKVWSRSKSLREKLTSLWSENITEVAREGGSDEVELNWDSYEKANQEISSDKLKLAEEKAITKEQDKMRAEEAAHGKYREDEESCGKKYFKRERDQLKGRTKKTKQNKKNATTSRSKLKKRLTKIHKKKTSLGIIPIGKYMVVSYSQAGETGLGTDKEREEKEEEEIFHYLIISKLARTNKEMSNLIQGIIASHRLNAFKNLLREGVYELSVFDVARRNSHFKLCETLVCFRFTEECASLVFLMLLSIPTEMFRFCKYEQRMALANSNVDLFAMW
ncbi:unnamed protein product [Brassica napus]|uniref:(rape) hypothetical protein n=1 Tax=Brassica napus TaxID=3708 RepID=A0A816V4Q9_BRANA|nr:unnamed protein product [Brassica napus]